MDDGMMPNGLPVRWHSLFGIGVRLVTASASGHGKRIEEMTT